MILTCGRRFVREQLAVTRTLVVVTRKYAVRRRYVTHVFLKGRYLNQELVTKGLAKVV